MLEHKQESDKLLKNLNSSVYNYEVIHNHSHFQNEYFYTTSTEVEGQLCGFAVAELFHYTID